MSAHIQILRPCVFTQILRTGTLHVQPAVPCRIPEAFAATAAPNGPTAHGQVAHTPTALPLWLPRVLEPALELNHVSPPLLLWCG